MSDAAQGDFDQDGLSRPLKAKGGKAAGGKGRLAALVPAIRFAPLAFALSGAFFLSIGAYLVLVHDPYGGEPVAISVIQPRALPDPEDEAPAAASPSRGPAQAADLERQAGVNVTRLGGAGAPGAVVITVPPQGVTSLAPAPDPRLVERSRLGILPRIGADGARPMDVYARPVVPLPSGATPAARIAIVVGGLGISQSATADALVRLPRATSLAFAPYGRDLERNVTAAREAGHEVLLQAPMEPFDYPDNDPGPHTLLGGTRTEENVGRLNWLMARFPGYVGIGNFMGGRLTSEESALAPILREMGERGLFFFDDGSSPRSVARAVGAKTRTPVVRAEIVLDVVPNPAAIDGALQRLEALARDKGVATASASALPVSVERIARWAAGLEQKGILLVPVSSLARNDAR